MGGFTHDPNASDRSNDIGNELDSALASALDNLHDIRFNSIFSDDEVRDEANVIRLLDEVLDAWPMIAQYIL
jgi:hypothetical protein